MDILFQDKNIIVCIKPVGVDSEKGFPLMLREQCNTDIFTLHRLDVNVGGLMVYAKNKHTAAELSKVISEGRMIKEYVALVHGTPEESGVYEDLLFKDSGKNKVFVVKKMRRGVKSAKLEYKRLTTGDTSLVHIRLYTGRSHQIRVQFASRGFPLVGDHKYGSRSEEVNPMLYSCRLTFPYKDRDVTYESKPTWAII